ncbi:hypothetical protein BOTNAR_0228g00060 [Botryotinia narcissicola]|uniref:Uncharacterized protein n=1 Tax=Botryotinia narcissicola TaxID=278944 RepID=A0A4Z1IHR2_9HELO|nr:hypothetical protein BOTNAR_0228g00060 [Botryotinia narcissicola]
MLHINSNEIHNDVTSEHLGIIPQQLIIKTLRPQNRIMISYRTSEKSGMQAPLLDKDEGIYFRCMDCKTRYECIIQVLQDLNPSDATNQGYDRVSYLLRMQCIFRQFEAWACSISTFQDDLLSKIFEFCIKDSTELKRTVMTILGTLQEFLYEVWLIFTQKKANESWPL